jgi:hypothetical protein
MGFFNLYKPRTYGYRYIYYDPKKEAQKEREKQHSQDGKNVDFKPSIRRGSFRESVDSTSKFRNKQIGQSNLRVIIIVFFLLVIVYYFLK